RVGEKGQQFTEVEALINVVTEAVHHGEESGRSAFVLWRCWDNSCLRCSSWSSWLWWRFWICWERERPLRTHWRTVSSRARGMYSKTRRSWCRVSRYKERCSCPRWQRQVGLPQGRDRSTKHHRTCGTADFFAVGCCEEMQGGILYRARTNPEVLRLDCRWVVPCQPNYSLWTTAPAFCWISPFCCSAGIPSATFRSIRAK